MVNFTHLAEKHYTDETMALCLKYTQQFDVGTWKSIPKEMVEFGGMLLNDGIFRLPFPLCLFGGDHDFLDNRSAFPEGIEAALDDHSKAQFPWSFRRDERFPADLVFTRSFAIDAMDLGEFAGLQAEVRKRCLEVGEEMKADFIFKVFADYGGDRGWEWAGSMVLDQGGEFYWVENSPVHLASEGVSERVNSLLSYGMGFFALDAVLGVVGSLAAKSTRQEIVKAPEKLNRARSKRGKLPIYEYRRLLVGYNADMPRSIDGRSIEGRAPPRMHVRRGHYRTLGNSARVPVAPCLVGLSETGVIDKQYIIAKFRDKRANDEPRP